MRPACAAGLSRCAFAAASSAVAASPASTVDGTCRSSSRVLRVRGRSQSGGSRSAGTARRAPPSVEAPAHPSLLSSIDNATPTARHRPACKPAAATAPWPPRTPPGNGEPARSPFFCVDLVHHLDLEVALGDELLQPRVLRLEALPATHVVGLQRAEPPPPDVDRLLGNAWRLATAAIGSRSASRRIATICSSVNLDLRMLSSDSEGSLSSNRWSENPGAGQPYGLLTRSAAACLLHHAPGREHDGFALARNSPTSGHYRSAGRDLIGGLTRPRQSAADQQDWRASGVRRRLGLCVPGVYRER